MVGRFIAPFAGGLLISDNNFRLVYLVDGIIGILALLAAFSVPSPKANTTTEGNRKLKRRDIGQEILFVLKQHTILATSGIEAAQYFAYGCLETYLPIYLSEKLGFSTAEIGFLFTAQILAATLTKPLMGRISDRYGRIIMISAGLILGGISLELITYAANFFLLLVLIGLFGLGLATVTASTSALVADQARASCRGSSLGILSSIYGHWALYRTDGQRTF